MSAVGRVPVTPNQVTVVGLALTFLAACLVAFGQLRWAGVVLVFAGTCDILDGALARSTRASYPYGAFLDSTLDRYAEGAIYIGLAAYFISAGGPLERWLVLATLAALAGSFLVSYVRARAQSLGFICDPGLFARPERVVVTVIGSTSASVWGTTFRSRPRRGRLSGSRAVIGDAHRVPPFGAVDGARIGARVTPRVPAELAEDRPGPKFPHALPDQRRTPTVPAPLAVAGQIVEATAQERQLRLVPQFGGGAGTVTGDQRHEPGPELASRFRRGLLARELIDERLDRLE